MRSGTWFMALALLACGFTLGRLIPVEHISAQEAEFQAPGEETQKKIQAANDALKAAVEALKGEDRYRSATKSLNSYAALNGELNAIQDLEDGRGVDPETFAGLYAGDAIPEIAPHLGKDQEGRLTYKGRLIRMYPVSRLQRLISQRMVVTGELTTRDASAPPTR